VIRESNYYLQFDIVSDQSKVRPQIAIVEEGSNLRLFCDYTAKEVTWFRNKEEPLPYNAVPEEIQNTLLIDKATVDNRGYYTCIGKSQNDETFYGRVTVKVEGKILHFVCFPYWNNIGALPTIASHYVF